MKKLLSPFTKGPLHLKNHVVMVPMTRSRALHNLPTEWMAAYYKQRSGAGLLITEGTAPSPEGLGYPRMPGIFSEAQITGWQAVTSAVHAGGSKIFLQLLHTGRLAHSSNLPAGYRPVGLSASRAAGEIFSDRAGMQEYSVPMALDAPGIALLIQAFVQAARNAVRAGFDGVELQGGNGYLLEQSLNPHVNNRTDCYGGTIENRARLLLEIVAGIAGAIGPAKVGVRLSPYSQLGDMPTYAGEAVDQTYTYLSNALNRLDVAYLHLADNPAVPAKLYQAIRQIFSNTLIYCNRLTAEVAEILLQAGSVDLVVFGRSFLANPDFIKRAEKNELL